MKIISCGIGACPSIITECGLGACPTLVLGEDDVLIVGTLLSLADLSEEIRAKVGQSEGVVRIPRSLLENWRQDT